MGLWLWRLLISSARDSYSSIDWNGRLITEIDCFISVLNKSLDFTLFSKHWFDLGEVKLINEIDTILKISREKITCIRMLYIIVIKIDITVVLVIRNWFGFVVRMQSYALRILVAITVTKSNYFWMLTFNWFWKSCIFEIDLEYFDGNNQFIHSTQNINCTSILFLKP